jgi:hypothetical protein
MKLPDYRERLATEPLTRTQLGAIQGEFRRLGLGSEASRPERLAISAAVLGLGELDSTHSLTQGDAGRLVRMLRDCASRADLGALVPAAGTSAPRRRPDFRRRLARTLAAALITELARQASTRAAAPGMPAAPPGRHAGQFPAAGRRALVSHGSHS